MGTHHGKDGSARVGANAIAEIQNWTVNENIGTADDTAMGDQSETHKPGVKSWDGNLTCSWDETDANGQETMVVGASVTLNLYPGGVGSGATYKTGTATITRVTLDTKRDGIVTRAFEFKGNGALSQTTV